MSGPEPRSMAWGTLVVDDEPPEAFEPGQGALRDPALGRGHETTRSRWGPASHVVLQRVKKAVYRHKLNEHLRFAPRTVKVNSLSRLQSRWMRTAEALFCW